MLARSKGLRRSGFKRSVKPKTTPKQKRKAKEIVRWGVKIWSTTKADTEFSKWIRALREKCELCGTREGLTCSHYIGRKAWAVRYSPVNCDVLCWSCHAKWEDRKQYEYRDWKIARLGLETHENLRELSKQLNGSKVAILGCMKLLGKA